eukprot:gene6018-7231_t
MAAEEEIKPEVKAELDSAHQEAQRVQALRQKFAKKRKIEELKKQALFAASKSTFGKALSCISAAVNLDPSDIDAWGHRARLFLMMGNIDAAIMDCENAMREAFKRKFTGKALGDIHGIDKHALETLMVGAAYGDGSHNVVQQLATLNENLQNEKACWAVPDEALVFDGLQTLKKERPVRDSAFEDAAETFFKSRDFKRAAEKYTEAIKIDLQNIDLYTRRAQCQEQLKNFSGVIQDCNRCLVLNRKAVQPDKGLFYRKAVQPDKGLFYRKAVEPHLLKGRAYLVQGQAARQKAQGAVNMAEDKFGPKHPSTATALNNLGGVLRSMGHYEAADEPYQRALGIREVALGDHHPGVAAVLNNLGGLYSDRSKLKLAKGAYERALTIWEKELGPEHFQVASVVNNLGLLLKKNGNVEEAHSMYLRALTIKEQERGPDHVSVATSLNNLGGLLASMGKNVSAEMKYRRCVEILEKNVGPRHPSLGTVLNNLAEALREQQKFEEAEPIYYRALEIWEESLGQNHPNVAQGMANVGRLFSSIANQEEIEKMVFAADEVAK